MRWGSENCLFAFEPALHAEGGFVNPFANTRLVTLGAADASRVGLEVVAGPKAQLATLHDTQSNVCIYVWGTMAHPKIAGDQLPTWCAKTIGDGELEKLGDLVGLFVVLIDDRARRRIHMFGDTMGVRPWFIGQFGGRTIAGSSVWPLQQAGLTTAKLNYDAVASWLYFGYDLTGGSLFEEYRRMTPGKVITIEQGKTIERPFVHIVDRNDRPPRNEIADFLFENISQTFDAMTAGVDNATVALSGGYDSRVLAALAARKKGLRAEALIVHETDADDAVAARVASAVHIRCQILPTDGSAWNMFDDPFHDLPEGFPITKQVTDVVAKARPGTPVLNGYMGDILVRSTGTPKDRELEFEGDETLVRRLTFRRRLPSLRFDLLEPAVERAIEERAQQAIHRLMNVGRQFGRPFLYTGLYGRQRCYTSNNMIQHLDVAESIVPFYSWAAIASRFRNDYDCFSWETYEALFQRHLPELAPIPHANRGDVNPRPAPRPSRCARHWAAGLLMNLHRRDCLPILNRRKAIPRLIGALIGRAEMEKLALFLQRIFLLDDRLCREGIRLDWRAI